MRFGEVINLFEKPMSDQQVLANLG